VSLTLARGEVALPVGLRLFLPSAWTDDAERCEAAGVPEAARTAQSKPEIALAAIDRVREAGVRFSCVLADAGFGSSPAFRQGLDARELAWAAGIACTQLVYPTTVKLRPAHTPTGRAAKHPIPNRPPRSAAEMLEAQRWHRITWRNGTKGPLNARFAAVRVRVADGPLNAESLFESIISMSYAATVVSVLPSVEVLSRKAPAWCLPNACVHRGSVLLPPNLSHQPVEIAYSNRL